jgi:hypothetical protein
MLCIQLLCVGMMGAGGFLGAQGLLKGRERNGPCDVRAADPPLTFLFARLIPSSLPAFLPGLEPPIRSLPRVHSFKAVMRG